tara:strand:+ start:111683 stop:112678 length:996 start_codon:yes stop_codon:yes gene_type:complete
MNRHLSALSLITLAALMTATPAKSADWSDTVFPTKTHDFGAVAVAAKTEFRFPIYNTFSTPMHIQSVRASCGCTTPIIETQYIPAGGTGSILARFNTGTFRGKKGATLTVVVTQPFYSEVRLRVDGYIRSDMVFHPGSIEFGKVDQGTAKSLSSRILYAGRDDWQVVDVQSNKPWLQPTVTQTTRGGGRVEYDLKVNVREDAPAGYFQDEIIVVTNDRSMPRVPLRVAGQVESALSISPQAIALGSLKPGQVIEKKLVIRGRTPFTIASIQCPGWDVQCDPTPEAKSTHIVTARFVPTEADGPQKATISISTTGDTSVVAHALLTADVRSH